MSNRKSLSDILRGCEDNLQGAWAATDAAAEFAPLPTDTYTCRAVSGELFQSRTGTPGYKLRFKVIEGEWTDRLIWHDLWLTTQALPMTKRDLQKLGVSSLEQLEQPLPAGIRAKVRVVLRQHDNGTPYNRVRSFEVIGIDPPEVDPFAPEMSVPPTRFDTTEETAPDAERVLDEATHGTTKGV